jgi:hypothetical protein
MSPVSFSSFTPVVSLDSDQKCTIKGGATFDVDGGCTLKVCGEANLNGLKNGDMSVSGQKIRVALSKKGAFRVSADVQNNNSEIEFNTGANILDKDVSLTYKNFQGGKDAENTIAADVALNDTNSLKITYDVAGLSGNNMFGTDRVKVAYTLVKDDFTITPEVDLSNNQITAKVGYSVDADNKVTVQYKQAGDKLKVTWENAANIGIDGALKVEAETTTSNLGNGLPYIKVTKTIDL